MRKFLILWLNCFKLIVSKFKGRRRKLMKQPIQQSDFRILLVEDDPGDVELIQILLTEQKSWAATLKNASTLSEGIALVQEDQEIDVVLLDLSLPDE